VLSSPERRRRRRDLLGLALLLSVLVHVTAGGIWAGFGHRIATVVAKVLPHPKETPTPPPLDAAPVAEIVIEHNAVAHRPKRTTPKVAPHRPAPRTVAQAPAMRPAPAPTQAPVATPAPTLLPAPPTVRKPQHVAVRAPRESATATPELHEKPAKNQLSPQQLAALNSQFRQAIADDQKAVTEAPPAAKGDATKTMSSRHFQLVMSGTPSEVSGQGYCDVDQTWYQGNTAWHYLTCATTYSDGFTERVSIPWPVHYPKNNDAPTIPGRRFNLTDPPASWSLPHPFALSRVTCAYFKSDCQAVIDREKANGDPSYGGDPSQ
jgi:hypothetical protein